MLDHQIAPKTQHIGCIKKRLFFSGDKELFGRPLQALFHAYFIRQIIGVVIFIGQAWLWGRLMTKIGILIPVLLHQRPVAQIFKPATAIRHRRLKNFRTDREQNIPGRHAPKLALRVEIRRGGWQRKIRWRRAVNAHAAFGQQIGKII